MYKRQVCGCFGKNVLREVPEETFLAALPQVRETAGDRAALRAMHVYAENRRAKAQADALRQGDFDGFLALVQMCIRDSLCQPPAVRLDHRPGEKAGPGGQGSGGRRAGGGF